MPLPGQTDVFDPRYGGRPLVPDPRDTAAQAIGATTANLPAINEILNQFDPNRSLEEQTVAGLMRTPTGTPASLSGDVISANLANLPNLYNIVQQIDPMIGKQRDLTGQFLEGKLPADVINQITQRAAERGVATGSPLSPNANAAYLAAIGGNSLALQQYGMGQAGRLANEVAGIEQPFFVTPNQEAAARESLVRTGLTGANQLASRLYGEASPFFLTPEQMQAAQMAANLYAAAPDPALAAQEAKRIQEEGAGKAAGTRGGTPTITPTYGGTRTPSRPPEDPSSYLDPFRISGTRTGAATGPYIPPTYVAPNTPMTPQRFGPTTPAPDTLDTLMGRSAFNTAQQAQINARAMQLMAQGYSYTEARQKAELEQRTGSFAGPLGDTSPTLAQFFGQQFADLGLPLVNDLFPEDYGAPTGPGEPPNYVEARTGPEYDYGQPFDYGTLPGFSAPAQPTNYVEARTGPEFDYGNIDFSTLPGFNFAPSDEEMDWYY